MLVGLLVALGLVVSAAGVVSMLQSGKLAALSGGDSNNAQAIAEAGADQIISVWNQPENRRLLVAGDATAVGDPAPNTATAATMTSPCLSSTNTRPGSNSGNPSTDAKILLDGNFRNIDDITQVATSTVSRQFRLKAIRYSTADPASSDKTNRRTLVRTFNVLDGKATTVVGTIPTGKSFRDLINVEDPDGSQKLQAGTNSGYIAVEVESKVFRNGVQVGTATVTKEFQVLPKCCGGSFGTNNTGGKSYSGSGSLGSDSRFCGVNFGMIVGLNSGKLWSYNANDFYKTIDPSTGAEVNLSNILGLVTDPTYKFERNDTSTDGGNGCRVIPGPCSLTTDLYATGATPTNILNDQTLYGSAGATIAGCSACGTTSDKEGKSASGISIIPMFINGSLPSVGDGVTASSSVYKPRFHYIWTSGGRPATNFASGGTFGPTLSSTGTSTRFRIRTRNDNGNPQVEFCDATYLASNLCTSTSWVPISLPQGSTDNPTLAIGDDFASNSYSGFTSGSNAYRWTNSWTTAGRVTINGSGSSAILRLSGDSTTTNTWASRAVNLHALQSPYLSFTQRVSDLSGSAPTLHVSYSIQNASPSTVTTGWIDLGTTTASGELTPTAPATGSCTLDSGSTYTCRIQLPPAAQTGFTKIRLRANSALTTTQSVDIDNVAITNSTGGPVSIDNWCEYSPTFPVTAQFTGGFHCLGPLLQMASGGLFIVDTSGGDISFYYNSAYDTRGTSLTSPLINMGAKAELRHVNCPNSGTLSAPPSPTGASVTPQNNCSTGIPKTVYAAVGENDLLNIFGRDSRPSSTTQQWFRIGSNSNSSGKISGIFLYVPWGSVYLIGDQCDGTGSAATSFNFFGRIWSRDLIACGSNYFVTPPSSSLNLSVLGINSFNLNNTGFVGWTGTDWQTNTSSATLVNSSL